MSDMIERVARALEPFAWSELAESNWKPGALIEARCATLAKARAAVEAMREPTLGMLSASAAKMTMEDDCWSADELSERYWNAMIDAALSSAPIGEK